MPVQDLRTGDLTQNNSYQTKATAFPYTKVAVADLGNASHPVNQTYLSGKQDGAGVVGDDQRADVVRPKGVSGGLDQRVRCHGDDIRGAGTRYVRGEFEPPILEYSTEESEAWQSFLPEVAVSLEKTDLL